MGIDSFACDVNPFLVWLAQTKAKIYSKETIENFGTTYERIAKNIEDYSEYKYPGMFNIKRWWGDKQLSYLAKLKTAIWKIKDDDVKNLLKIAFSLSQ